MIFIKKIRSIFLSNEIFRKIDFYVRLFFSKILYFEIDNSVNNNKIIVLYGGMGDCISWLNPTFNIKDTPFDVVFAIPDKYMEIVELLPIKHNIIYYKNFLSLALTLRNKYNNYVFIFVSPIIELKFLQLISGLKNGGGYLKNYTKLYKNTNEIIDLISNEFNNFYKRRLILLRELIDNNISDFNEEKKYSLLQLNSYEKLTILLSLEKSQSWNGKDVEVNEIIDIINVIHSRFPHAIIKFVGMKRIEFLTSTLTIKYNFLNLSGQTNAISLIGELKSSDLVISLESGISHLAYFFNKSVIVIQTYTDATNFVSTGGICTENISKCSPCVKLESHPVDIYPPLCKNSYICQEGLGKNLSEYLNFK